MAEQPLHEFPIRLDIHVHWGEMDAFQHLNNTVYFRYFETIRIEYFKAMGIIDSHDSTIVGPILAATDCKYIFPISFPDTITAGARVSEVREDRFIMKYALWSQRHDRLAAIGGGVVIPYNYKTLKKSTMPKDWNAVIEKIEAGG